MTVIINPGTGWTDGNHYDAAANLRALLRDAGVSDYEVESKGRNRENGRFKFDVRFDVPCKTRKGTKRRRLRVDIPGTYQWQHDVWTRCYINGDSWMREFAVQVIREIHQGIT